MAHYVCSALCTHACAAVATCTRCERLKPFNFSWLTNRCTGILCINKHHHHDCTWLHWSICTCFNLKLGSSNQFQCFFNRTCICTSVACGGARSASANAVACGGARSASVHAVACGGARSASANAVACGSARSASAGVELVALRCHLVGMAVQSHAKAGNTAIFSCENRRAATTRV